MARAHGLEIRAAPSSSAADDQLLDDFGPPRSEVRLFPRIDGEVEELKCRLSRVTYTFPSPLANGLTETVPARFPVQQRVRPLGPTQQAGGEGQAVE